MFNKIVYQIAIILFLSAILGLSTNSIRQDGIPFIRIPLKETRKFADVKPLRQQAIKATKIKTQKPLRQQIVRTTTKAEVNHLSDKLESKVVSLVKNSKLLRQQAIEATKKAKAAKPPQALFISLKDAKTFYDKNSCVFIDARPKEDFDVSHIAGAVSLTYSDFQMIADDVLSNISNDKTLITYCSDPECESAMELGDLLILRGYKKVFILIDGFPGWKKAGYPTESTDIKGNN
jgi:rhodanese-related sulfurtransferase